MLEVLVIDIRFDIAPLKVSKTDEGFLSGSSIVTRTGVFKYVNKDGSIRRELRHPDEVLNQDSLDTLKLKPVTDGHPPVLVNSKNHKQYSVGNIGENVNADSSSGNISVSYTIQDEKAIANVLNGKRELSLGYRLDLEEKAGIYNGEEYTHIQRNIRYNHLAIVNKARAGNVASINVDGEDADIYELNVDLDDDLDSRKDKQMNLIDINLDGLTYKASPEVVKEVEKLKASIANFDASAKELKAAADKAQANFDNAQEKIKELEQKVSNDSIDEIVNSRIELITKSSAFVNADSLKGLSTREIHEAVIKSKFKDVDNSKRSDEYVEARFDAILEDASKEDKAPNHAVKRLIAETIGRTDGDEKPVEKDLRRAFNARREDSLAKK